MSHGQIRLTTEHHVWSAMEPANISSIFYEMEAPVYDLVTWPSMTTIEGAIHDLQAIIDDELWPEDLCVDRFTH